MRKRLLFLFILFIYSLLSVDVYAETCTDDIRVKLNAQLYNVKFNYEIIEETSDEDLALYKYPINDYIKVTVINITPGMAIVMDDGLYEDPESEAGGGISSYQSFNYNDTEDGIYTFKVTTDVVHNFDVFISNKSEECPEGESRKLTFITPRFNHYSNLEECKGVEEYYCDKYLTSEIPYSKSEILSSISKLKKSDSSTNIEELSFFQKYGKIISLIIIGIIMLPISIVGFIYVRNYIRRRNIK